VTVLILAAEVDPCADRMVRALAERGTKVRRLDTAWFPQHVQLTAQLAQQGWCGPLRTEGGVARLEEITAIWYRAPSARSSMARRAHQHPSPRAGTKLLPATG
jgi:hypothetical protein